jgi:hypothetical protein
MPFHPPITQKVPPWLSISKCPFLPHALPRSSSLPRTQLFHYIPIGKHDQKAGRDAMIVQILTLSRLLPRCSVAESVIQVFRAFCSPHFRSIRAFFKADVDRRGALIDDSVDNAPGHHSISSNYPLRRIEIYRQEAKLRRWTI